jgi:hypothetical protein
MNDAFEIWRTTPAGRIAFWIVRQVKKRKRKQRRGNRVGEAMSGYSCKTCRILTQRPADGQCAECVAVARRAEVDAAFGWDHYTREDLREIGRAYNELAQKLLSSLPDSRGILRDLKDLKRRSIEAKILGHMPNDW